jgi:putrescine---pyruvate transaminase
MTAPAPFIFDRNTAAWQELDRQHYLHPFTDYKNLHAKGSRVIVKADGVYLYDSEGHRILDGMAGLWCVNLGYGRRELAEAAYRQMLELPYYNSFFQTAHPPAIELAKQLVDLTPPQFNRVFFTGSGSEGNDTVVRLVRRYWDLLGQPGRNVIISRHNAYHGSTMAGASLGGMGFMHEQGGLPIPDIVHIPQPYWYADGGDLSPAEFGLKTARTLEAKILELGPQRVAAFIGEPIQGAGGVIIPPDTYWPEIQKICDRYGILLVADEVICGFGRTGYWFGSERYGIKPDLMTIAKDCRRDTCRSAA